MSDRVSADVEGLRRLRRDIERAQQTIDGAISQLRTSLANCAWDDAARRSFEAELTQTIASLRQFHTKAEELKPILSRKIEALAAYLKR